MSEPVIEIRHLEVRYGRSRVLADVSLEVDAGEAVALLGRNGEGKTSLMRCLLGAQKPSAGSCRLFGEASWPRRPGLLRRVGFVPEEPDAPDGLSAEGLAAFSRRVYGSRISGSRGGAQSEDAWDLAGYHARLERYGISTETPFRSLSRGEKTQVMLSLALAHRPDLLLLDDPTLGLDAVARRGVFEEVVGEMAERGITVFLASHDLAGVEALATRVALLSGGEIVLDEEIDELKARHRWIDLHLEMAADGSLALPGKPGGEGPGGESSTEDTLETLTAEIGPILRRCHGRRLRLLTPRFDHALRRRLDSALGGPRWTSTSASLEEIVVALDGAPAPSGPTRPAVATNAANAAHHADTSET